MILQPKQIEKNIAWLLANGSTPIKYLTRKHLLETPVTARAVHDLWRNVEVSPCVQEIFNKQQENGAWHADGSWAKPPSYTVKGGIDPYRPKYVTTVWILPFLGEMGYTATDKRILEACRYVVSHGLFLNPLFGRPTKEISRSIIDFFFARSASI